MNAAPSRLHRKGVFFSSLRSSFLKGAEKKKNTVQTECGSVCGVCKYSLFY